MDEKDFALRLAQLREKKNVSAREMSLAIGQNPGYINNIENGKAMPSLNGIFYICDYYWNVSFHFSRINVRDWGEGIYLTSKETAKSLCYYFAFSGMCISHTVF